jgi:ABC-type uncharacterized transport system substrate-binding protein
MGLRRREFITLLGGAAAWPVAGRAQSMPAVGLLDGGAFGPFSGAVREGLGEAGFVEGRNLSIEIHSANGHYDLLPIMAAELVRRRVAVIATNTPVAAIAAKVATSSIPIVFSLGSDPIKDGLVTSFNRPGGNITGVTFFSNLLTAKRLELLHRLAPGANAFALLSNPRNINAELELSNAEAASRMLGRQLLVEKASNEADIDAAFARIVRQGAAAIFLAGDVYFSDRRDQIVALASRYRIPTSHSNRESVAAGGLMSYGPRFAESYRQAGVYVGRILKGERPGDLPVMQPTTFHFVVNMKTAQALGITVPPTLLALVDEVIE